MVAMQNGDSELQTDVVFIIEATSMNGTYINELKSSYITPILEYEQFLLLQQLERLFLNL